MNTKYLLGLALAGTALFASCKNDSPHSLLTGSWQGTTMRNDAMEEMVAAQRALLDTLGNNTQPADWPALYGTSNMDSFKKEGYKTLDALQAHLKESATKTNFNFRTDSVAILTFEGAADSVRWSVEGDTLLVLTEMEKPGVTANPPLRMSLKTLTKDSLSLSFTERDAQSVMNFRRAAVK
jgi:hypothetical protein